LADNLYARGVTARVAVPDLAYIVLDPEANMVELYTPPPLLAVALSSAAAAPLPAVRSSGQP
jgi:hypothetical protein